jgi:hypothetical protein
VSECISSRLEIVLVYVFALPYSVPSFLVGVSPIAMALRIDAQWDIDFGAAAEEKKRIFLDADTQEAQIEAKAVGLSQNLCATVIAGVPKK